jgi:hypothetical protein
LALAFFPFYFLCHIIIYAVLRITYQPMELGGFGTITASFLNRFKAGYRGFVTGWDDGVSGSSTGFGPDREALVSPPSYDALKYYDIVSTVTLFNFKFHDSNLSLLQDTINHPFPSSSYPQAHLK